MCANVDFLVIVVAKLCCALRLAFVDFNVMGEIEGENFGGFERSKAANC